MKIRYAIVGLILLSLTFTSCSPSLQSGGWIIPSGLAATAVWTWCRYFFGIRDISVKRTTGPLIYAIILTLAAVGSYIAMVSAA